MYSILYKSIICKYVYMFNESKKWVYIGNNIYLTFKCKYVILNIWFEMFIFCY